ncbi:MAG: MarR family winged helix-turn-helix transcriptional regulator [Eubacteriales bacterium]|nr:MarR family winged helix-turn-helix transcriptional regulator [Eubacteriales bacterium]
MKKESLNLINDINRAIVQVRGIYSTWSAEHGISYHEMLVLYTIREFGFCTQKQICDSYLIPRQTINNVITGLREKGVLVYSREHSIGREKVFVLSEEGEEYVTPLLASLDTMESGALAQFGSEKLAALTHLLLEYNKALYKTMDETK